MQSITANNFYQTSDFSLAATLSVWVPLVAVDRTNPRRSCFLFERSQELDTLVEAFHQRQLSVEPQTYYGAIRALKARLYEDS